MAKRVVIDPRGLEAVLRSTQALGALEQLTGTVADNARAIARAEAFDTGDYHDSIENVVGIEAGRATGRVIADDFKAVWIEDGTGPPAPTPPRAVLRRAAEKAGLRVVRGR